MWPFKSETDPFSASRYSGDMFKSVRTRERKHFRHWWQWAILGLAVLLFLGAGFGVWQYFKFYRGIRCEPACETDPVVEGKPFNALLVGSDSRGDLTEQEQLDLGADAVDGERADTLILAHIDPATDRVTMIQFPRDLYVPIVDGGTNKINGALLNGPKQLLQTMRQLTGLKINHYLEVNIAGFRDLVDAIGGVEVCITEPIPFDTQTGIEITEEELGMVHFDGDRALRFVRARAVFATGDFERIQNQQKFVAAAIDQVTSTETLFRPGRILKLLDVAGKNLETDLPPRQLPSFAERLRSFDPERYEAYTVPNLGTTTNEAGSVVLPDTELMDLMFEAIGKNESPAEADGVPNIEPSTIRVGVYNGSFIDGVAASVAEELKVATTLGAGPVQVVDITNADRLNYKKTVIRFRPEARLMAELIAAAMPQAELLEGKTKANVDVAVIVGKKGYETEKIFQLNPIPLPKPGALPKVCQE
ncbi:MAG TPA: LCP family protein [Actinomycetota bacterium]|nr:LCP family protein [Actinomycetota bacterium]